MGERPDSEHWREGDPYWAVGENVLEYMVDKGEASYSPKQKNIFLNKGLQTLALAEFSRNVLFLLKAVQTK